MVTPASAAARAKDPGASLRACSYHASPGGSKASVLCISLWMIYSNTLVSPCENVENVVVEKWITAETPALAQAAACGCHTRSGARL